MFLLKAKKIAVKKVYFLEQKKIKSAIDTKTYFNAGFNVSLKINFLKFVFE